jgi:hypothetical protein
MVEGQLVDLDELRRLCAAQPESHFIALLNRRGLAEQRHRCSICSALLRINGFKGQLFDLGAMYRQLITEFHVHQGGWRLAAGVRDT